MIKDIKDKFYAYWLIGSTLCIFFALSMQADGKTLFKFTGNYPLNIVLDYLFAVTPIGGAVGFMFLWMVFWFFDHIMSKLLDWDKGTVLNKAMLFVRFVAEKILPKIFDRIKKRSKDEKTITEADSGSQKTDNSDTEQADSDGQKIYTDSQNKSAEEPMAYTDVSEKSENIEIQCPKCKAVYKVNYSKIPANGTHARCRKCQTKFFVSK